MKFADHLDKATIQKFNQIRRAAREKEVEKVIVPQEAPKRKIEKFSRRDLEDLMDVRRVTYKRVGGAVRRK